MGKSIQRCASAGGGCALSPGRGAPGAMLAAMDQDLDRAVRTVVERCLAIGEGDDVLIVCDPDRENVAQALLRATWAAGGDGALTVLPPKPERGTEPPATVAAAF